MQHLFLSKISEILEILKKRYLNETDIKYKEDIIYYVKNWIESKELNWGNLGDEFGHIVKFLNFLKENMKPKDKFFQIVEYLENYLKNINVGIYSRSFLLEKRENLPLSVLNTIFKYKPDIVAKIMTLMDKIYFQQIKVYGKKTKKKKNLIKFFFLFFVSSKKNFWTRNLKKEKMHPTLNL